MNTPQNSKEYGHQHSLEEKLRVHIQREFNLGEKVIFLLKQKKLLEEDLQKQHQAQKSLENKLNETLKSKETFEQRFLQTQENLQKQQQTLRTRSRIIIEDQEGSREALKSLRKKLQKLEQQLEVADQQKTEDLMSLFQRIQELRQKEQEQSQQLNDISQKRDVVEKHLRTLRRKYKQLFISYQHEKKQHEEQIELLFSEQSSQETQINKLLDEHKLNEEQLQQEVEALKLSKVQLEKKVKNLEQDKEKISQELDSNLLHVIEKQQRHIEELKIRARDRSTMLKAENASLKEAIEKISSSQEKAAWEKQMLESSLKDLQTDLAEYIQLQKKVEQVQREKENFEEKFQRKIQFLDDNQEENNERQKSSQENFGKKRKVIYRKRPQDSSRDEAEELSQNRVSFRKSRLLDWINDSHERLLNTVLILIVIVLSIEIYRLVPWRYILLNTHTQTELKSSKDIPDIDVLAEEFPGVPEEEEELESDDIPLNTSLEIPSKKHQEVKVLPADEPAKTSQPPKEILVSNAEKQPESATSVRRRSKTPKRPVNIVVQLSQEQADRYLSQKAEPFPTAENNSILRRHYERKGTVF